MTCKMLEEVRSFRNEPIATCIMNHLSFSHKQQTRRPWSIGLRSKDSLESSCPTVTAQANLLVWGSLRLAPIIANCLSSFQYEKHMFQASLCTPAISHVAVYNLLYALFSGSI